MGDLAVVLIVGSGYSGTTLLDLLLGSHPAMRGVGELRSFDEFVEEDGRCTCGTTASSCPFWDGVRGGLGRSFRLYPPGATVPVVVERTTRLLRAVAAASTDVIVDSSKWVQRAELLAATGQFDCTVIHLVRDGRGVLASRLRRGLDAEPSIELWCRQNRRILAWLDGSPGVRHTRLRYEDLARRPVPVLHDLCRLIGVDFDPRMLEFRRVEHHLVAGNLMRFDGGSAIVVDQRWRTELDDEHLRCFERIAGSLNSQLGYPPAQIGSRWRDR